MYATYKIKWNGGAGLVGLQGLWFAKVSSFVRFVSYQFNFLPAYIFFLFLFFYINLTNNRILSVLLMDFHLKFDFDPCFFPPTPDVSNLKDALVKCRNRKSFTVLSLSPGAWTATAMPFSPNGLLNRGAENCAVLNFVANQGSWLIRVVWGSRLARCSLLSRSCWPANQRLTAKGAVLIDVPGGTDCKSCRLLKSTWCIVELCVPLLLRSTFLWGSVVYFTKDLGAFIRFLGV